MSVGPVPSSLPPNSTQFMSVGVTIGSLPPGVYHALIGSIPVVLNADGPTIEVTPILSAQNPVPGLVFSSTTAVPNPAAQTLTVKNIGASAMNVTTGPVTYSAGQPTGWLQAAQLSNVYLVAGQSTTPSVSVQVGSLPAGSYSASFTVTAANATNTPQVVSVTLNVAGPTIGLSSSALTFTSTAATPNPLPQALTVTNSGSAAMNVTTGPVTYAAGQPTGWLNPGQLSNVYLVAGQSTTPSVSVQVGSLPAGSYSASFTITAANATNTPQVVSVTLNVAGPTIGLSSSALTFTSTAATPNPLPQVLTVTNSGSAAMNVTTGPVTYAAGQPTGWLNPGQLSNVYLVAGQSTTPSVSVQVGSLPAGSYSASFPLTAPNASNTPQTVTVSLTIPPPTIAATPAAAVFAATVGGASPAPSTITLSNGGLGSLGTLSLANVTFHGAVSNWLIVGFNSGPAPRTLTITPSTTSLPAGTHTATITIASSTAGVAPLVFPVSYTLTQAPTIALSATTASISGSVGATPPTTSIGVTNGGTGVLDGLSVQGISYAAGAPTGWLLAGFTGAVAPAQLQLDIDASSPLPGGQTYTATVTVASTAAGITNSPQQVTVSYTVAGIAQIAVLKAGAPVSSLPFFATTQVLTPPPVSLTITNTGNASTDLTIGAPSYGNGQPTGWLQFDATPATLAPNDAITRTVQVDATGLPLGPYSASVTLTGTNGAPPVTLFFSLSVNAPVLSIAPTSVAFSATASGATPPASNVDITIHGAAGTIDGLAIPQITYSSGAAGWLSAVLSTPSAPSTIALSILSTALPAGSYTAQVTVSSTSTGVQGNPATFSVNYTVAAPAAAPTIALSATSVALSASAGGAPSGETGLAVSNGGTGVLDGLTVGGITYGSGGTGWLTATLDGALAPATLSLVGTPGSLAAGTYTASVMLLSTAAGVTNSPRSLPVTFTVVPSATPTIVLSTSTLAFTVGAGSGVSPAEIVDITNGGTTALSGLASTIIYGTGQPTGWLRRSLSGTSAPSAASVSVDAAPLPAGSYTAVLRIRSTTTGIVPQDIAVTLTVSGAAPSTVVAPTALAFSGTPGSGFTPYQLVDITNGGGGTLSGLTTRITYPTGSPTGWLRVTLSAPAAPATASVRATIGSGLVAGSYDATLEVRSTVGTTPVVAIPVTLTVSGTLPVLALSRQAVAISAVPTGVLPSAEVVNLTNTGGGRSQDSPPASRTRLARPPAGCEPPSAERSRRPHFRCDRIRPPSPQGRTVPGWSLYQRAPRQIRST